MADIPHPHFANQEQFNERIRELLKQEENEPVLWWYLSFAGPEGFRGGVYVRAKGMVSAIGVCNVLGINPHGEVMGIPIPADGPQPRSEYGHRLLTKEEIEAAVPPVN